MVFVVVLAAGLAGASAEEPLALVSGDSSAGVGRPSLQAANQPLVESSMTNGPSLREAWYFSETESDTETSPYFPYVFKVGDDVVLSQNDEAVYVGRPQGLVSKLDATNGNVLWSTRVGGKSTLAVLTNDNIEVTTVGKSHSTSEIRCVVLSTRTGKVVGSRSFDEIKRDMLMTHMRQMKRTRTMTITNGMDLAQTTLETLRKSGGKSVHYDDGVICAPTSTNGLLFASFSFFRQYDETQHIWREYDKIGHGLAGTAGDFWLVAYQQDGRSVWKQPLRTLSVIEAVSSNEVILSAHLSGRCLSSPDEAPHVVYAVRKDDGRRLWEYAFRPDDSHGVQRPTVGLFGDYVCIAGDTFARPDRPFRVNAAAELNLVLLNVETGKEECFHRGAHGKVILGNPRIVVNEGSGLRCYVVAY